MSEPNKAFLIFKRGRGWYRPESQGYTAFKFDAGRYTEQEAIAITHPNGPDGPRDGMSYRHESEVRDAPSAHIEELEAKLAKAVEALENLARLGNGDRYGNSDGNMVARNVLAELKGDNHD